MNVIVWIVLGFFAYKTFYHRGLRRPFGVRFIGARLRLSPEQKTQWGAFEDAWAQWQDELYRKSYHLRLDWILRLSDGSLLSESESRERVNQEMDEAREATRPVVKAWTRFQESLNESQRKKLARLIARYNRGQAFHQPHWRKKIDL